MLDKKQSVSQLIRISTEDHKRLVIAKEKTNIPIIHLVTQALDCKFPIIKERKK